MKLPWCGRYFSATEIAAYERLAPELRTPAFFNGWTRKEAYVKAVGRGWGCRWTASMCPWEGPPRRDCCALRPYRKTVGSELGGARDRG